MKKLIMIGLIFGVGTSLLLAGNLNYAYAGNYSPSIGSGFRCGNLLMSEGLDKLQVLAMHATAPVPHLTDTAPGDGRRGLRRYFDGWVDATPENTTTVVAGDDGKRASGWTYRGQLPASDGPSIIGDRAWDSPAVLDPILALAR